MEFNAIELDDERTFYEYDVAPFYFSFLYRRGETIINCNYGSVSHKHYTYSTLEQIKEWCRRWAVRKLTQSIIELEEQPFIGEPSKNKEGTAF